MSQGMHPEDIKAAIRKRGETMASLSREWGFSEAAISVALKRPLPSVDPLISKFIGVPLYKIWPDRYDRENIRIRPIRKSKLAQRRARVTAKNNVRNLQTGRELHETAQK